jgi:GntR family transcriptional regulator
MDLAGSKLGYKEIAEELRARIERGQYGPGDPIPSESEVMTEFSAGRETVTKALRVLRDQGLTVGGQGRPATVRDFKPIRRSANERLSRAVWGAGTSMWSVDVRNVKPKVAGLEIESFEASARVAESLGIPRGQAVVRRRRHYVLDGRPVLMSDSYIPLDLAEGTPIMEPDTGEGGIYKRLEEVGHGPVRFKEEVRVRMPNSRELAVMKLGPGTPVACVVRTAFEGSGRAVEVNEMTLDGGSYILDYVIDA